MNWILWQFNSRWQKADESLKKLETELQVFLADKPVTDSVLILPEMFATGFSMQPEQIAEKPFGMVSRRLSALAGQYGLQIIAGVAQENAQGYENNALYFDREGLLQATYSKQKLFSYAQEPQSYIAGNQPVVIELVDTLGNGIKAALFICYDLRFPELFRQVAKKVDVLIVIANWPVQRQLHWRLLLQARAIENQAWVIGVNRVGTDGSHLDYIGGSMVIDPYGTIVHEPLETEISEFAISLAEMLERVEQYRNCFPALADQ